MVEDSAETREHEEDKNDQDEAKAPIKYTYLGSEDCPVTPEMDDIEFSMSYRIPKIENLEQCTELKVSLLTCVTWLPCTAFGPAQEPNKENRRSWQEPSALRPRTLRQQDLSHRKPGPLNQFGVPGPLLQQNKRGARHQHAFQLAQTLPLLKQNQKDWKPLKLERARGLGCRRQQDSTYRERGTPDHLDPVLRCQEQTRESWGPRVADRPDPRGVSS